MAMQTATANTNAHISVGIAILLKNIAEQLQLEDKKIHKAQRYQPGHNNDDNPGNFGEHSVTGSFGVVLPISHPFSKGMIFKYLLDWRGI
jgi:hypothetical protein